MSGTTAEAVKAPGQEQAQQSASGTGLEGKKGSTKETYTQAEVEELWKSREGKIGLKIKTERDTFKTQWQEVTKERDTFKGQLDSLTAEIAEHKQNIESLTKEIDALSAEGPEGGRKLAELRKERERELNEAKTLKASVSETVKEAAKFKRDQLVYAVAAEHGQETPKQLDAFMEAADDLNRNTREELTAMAKYLILTVKEETEPKEEEFNPHVPDSGRNSGGGIDFDSLSPREKIEEGLKRNQKK